MIDNVYGVGRPVYPASAPNGRKHTRSGLSVVVSEVEFDDYKLQMEEAYLFMRDHADELTHLAGFAGVEALCIDFGANIYPPGWCSFRFPHPLLRMAGELKIDLDLSVYPTVPEDESDGDKEREELDEAYEELQAQEGK
ncbi:hypothetical protein V2O64_08320 [Verrucomicrobiaceae bacterium 227]